MKENNFQITINKVSKEDLKYWKDYFKFETEPVWFIIDLPKRHECTFGLLNYKLAKDLKVQHFGDSDYFIEKDKLSEVKKYIKEFYDGYLKT